MWTNRSKFNQTKWNSESPESNMKWGKSVITEVSYQSSKGYKTMESKPLPPAILIYTFFLGSKSITAGTEANIYCYISIKWFSFFWSDLQPEPTDWRELDE